MAGWCAVPSLIAISQAVWQVGVFRASAWAARGLRVPARNALLAAITTPEAYGRADGFERAMDSLGAIGGPLLAILLLGLVGVRSAIGLSVIRGLAAAVAIAAFEFGSVAATLYILRHPAAAPRAVAHLSRSACPAPLRRLQRRRNPGERSCRPYRRPGPVGPDAPMAGHWTP